MRHWQNLRATSHGVSWSEAKDLARGHDSQRRKYWMGHYVITQPWSLGNVLWVRRHWSRETLLWSFGILYYIWLSVAVFGLAISMYIYTIIRQWVDNETLRWLCACGMKNVIIIIIIIIIMHACLKWRQNCFRWSWHERSNVRGGDAADFAPEEVREVLVVPVVQAKHDRFRYCRLH